MSEVKNPFGNPVYLATPGYIENSIHNHRMVFQVLNVYNVQASHYNYKVAATVSKRRSSHGSRRSGLSSSSSSSSTSSGSSSNSTRKLQVAPVSLSVTVIASSPCTNDDRAAIPANVLNIFHTIHMFKLGYFAATFRLHIEESPSGHVASTVAANASAKRRRADSQRPHFSQALIVAPELDGSF